MAVRRVVATTIAATLCVVVLVSVLCPLPGVPSLGPIYIVRANPDWLSGFDYRKNITINGTVGAGTNYQVPLRVYYDVDNATASTGFTFDSMLVDYDAQFGEGVTGEDSKIAEVNGTYYMATAIGATRDTMEIHMLNATSLTGPWGNVTNDPVIERGISAWDSYNLRATGLTNYDGTYYLYYAGSDTTVGAGLNITIGVATTSADDFPLNWTKYGSNPIMWPTSEWPTGTIDALDMQRVGLAGNEWYGHFAGNNGTVDTSGIGYCYGSSPYGPFTRGDAPVVFCVDKTWEDTISRNSFIVIGDTLYGAYEAHDEGSGVFETGMYYGDVGSDMLNATFSKHPDNPVIAENDGTGQCAANPCYWYEDEVLYLFIGSFAVGLTDWYVDLFDRSTYIFCESNCQVDFDDLRFTDDDEITLLDYWVENSTSGNYADVWVEVADDLNATKSIWLYYGNGTATSVSNGANTFLLFDHFDDASFDTGIWDALNSPTLSESGTTLTITTADNNWRGINSDTDYDLPKRLRLTGSLDRVASLHYNWLGLSNDQDPNDTSVCFYYYYSGTTNKDYSQTRVSPDQEVQTVTGADANMHIYEIGWLASDLARFYVDDYLANTHTTYIQQTGIHVGAGVYASPSEIVLDWVFLGQLVDPDPDLLSVGSQESEPSGCSPSISLNTSSWDANSGDVVATSSNYSSGLTYFTITNNSGGAVDISVSAVNMTGGGYTWVLDDNGSPGDMTYGLFAGLDGEDYHIITKLNTPYNTLVANLADSGTQDFGLRMRTPTNFDDGNDKSGNVTLTVACS